MVQQYAQWPVSCQDPAVPRIARQGSGLWFSGSVKFDAEQGHIVSERCFLAEGAQCFDNLVAGRGESAFALLL
jgi:hypothetical protein